MRLRSLRTLLVGMLAASALAFPADFVSADVDFAREIQPILEMYCVSCHSADHTDGDVDLSTIEKVRGSEGLLVPGKPEESSLYTLVAVEKDDPQLMPPADQGGPLKSEYIAVIGRLQIASDVSRGSLLVPELGRARGAGPPLRNILAALRLVATRPSAHRRRLTNLHNFA